MHTTPNLLYTKEDLKYHMRMCLEENRLESFKNWVFDDDQPCNAVKMAECGFYFVGNSEEPDSVQCFLCNKTLDGWESGDDPWEEHMKHAPYCEFVKLKQPQSALTLVQIYDFKKLQVENYVNKLIGELKKEYDATIADIDKLCDVYIK